MGVSEQLVRILNRSGMAQAELARRLGVRRSWVNRRVKGSSAIMADEVPRLAQALGVTILDLYADGDDPLRPATADFVAQELMRGVGGIGTPEARFAAALADLLRSYRGEGPPTP